MSRHPSALSLLLCWVGHVSTAHAYQNPARFLEDAVETGGSNKRFFTGSPADGYTCKVCHAPGNPVHVDVAGLPLDGYTLGASYLITLDWPDDLKAVGVNLEITDAAGVAAGELNVPPVAQLTAADLCTGGTQSGSGVFPLEGRAVALVGECGQHQTTLQWTAPITPPTASATGGAGTLWFSGSLVVSNADSTLAGDRVTDLRRALAPAGAAEPSVSPVTAASSCQLLGGAGHTGGRFARAWQIMILVMGCGAARAHIRSSARRPRPAAAARYRQRRWAKRWRCGRVPGDS